MNTSQCNMVRKVILVTLENHDDVAAWATLHAAMIEYKLGGQSAQDWLAIRSVLQDLLDTGIIERTNETRQERYFLVRVAV